MPGMSVRPESRPHALTLRMLGTIPAEIGHLTALLHLDSSHNKLIGMFARVDLVYVRV